MGKNQKHDTNDSNISNSAHDAMKVTKRTRKSVPMDSPSQRSSVYRGVTRHRWTGRYEAHLWDKNCWNETQNKKGKQVYLGAYDDEETAAHAYDLAALKYWGHTTILNFPLSTYQEELKGMEGQSKEEYIGSLRRKSNGFSRGVSKYRGVARHHHNGRWEARIGRVFGNKYLYLGTYATQEEAATAYDMAALEYRGLNAVTNFDLSRYINWLRPNSDVANFDQTTSSGILSSATSNNNDTVAVAGAEDLGQSSFFQQKHEQFMRGEVSQHTIAKPPAMMTMNTPPALGFLLESQKFEEMVERTPTASSSSSTSPPPPPSTAPRQCSFPDGVQTYFKCHNGGEGFTEEEDFIFGDLNDLMSPIFQFELDF